MTDLVSGAAFFALLERCERRIAQVRRRRLGVRLLRSAVAVLALAALATAGSTWVADPEPGRAVWLVASAGAALVALATWIFAERPAARRLSADQHQVIEDVNRLREVLAHFARREGWDDDRIRSVRRRLSAFPLRSGRGSEAA
ncbi:hypothetical protein [Jiangella alba]|uniref:Uncharacterized protein n=1 Tax=Jiangella alba TaxID=561176 RepID=A0A1H5PRV3_9ACTN|nr:hypothetical protein [Jiangella alba]SEF16496.1 hypothetical protein SAMN04488561_5403 [Jiangella alba]